MQMPACFRYRESGLVVQALKALGREHMNQEVIERIRQQLEPQACGRILSDTRSVTGWVYEAIKQICKKAA